MITTCCMKDCPSQINDVKQINKIRFHRFPLNRPGMVTKWLQAIDRPDFKLKEYNVVCGNHFEADDYKIENAVVKLKITAVPKKIVAREKQLIDEAELFRKELNDKFQAKMTQSRIILIKPNPVQSDILPNGLTRQIKGKNTLRKICMGVQANFPTDEEKLERKLKFLKFKLRKQSQEIQELRTLIFQFAPQEYRKNVEKKT